MTSALVLGGGGVTGIAWETGMLYGLEQLGVNLRTAGRLVGTSAGSTVAAQLASGTSLEQLFAAQRDGAVTERAASLGAAGIFRLVSTLAFARDRERALRTLGAASLARSTPEQATARRDVIRQRVPVNEWPDSDLRIPAVEVETGRLRVFTAADGVPLVDAVAASCAVPLVWPPIEIQGRHYIDGGLPFVANVQLAAGCDPVVVLAPIAGGIGRGTSVRAQLSGLEPRPRSLSVSPDRTARRALGRNSLDPAARRASAIAGYEQAARVAPALRDFVRGAGLARR
ncbi:patatin-like phospholipase family protein [Rathayibacter sp. YIM 133350]|uniref:patatin-like phospholipase family protein n=1 Tax=Rathayibacter sp. YIM 133350 TaxID=3131992 RepID=UPI00307DE174